MPETSGLLGRLGLGAHCVRCNTKFRVQGRVSATQILWIVKGAWLAAWLTGVWWLTPVLAGRVGWLVLAGIIGMAGLLLARGMASWLWWAHADVQVITTISSDSSFLDVQ